MYENQTDSMAFHELLPAAPVGVRAAIEGVAQRALRQAGVECDTLEVPGGYASIIGRSALQQLPGIAEAQEEMRTLFDTHFGSA